MSASKKLFAKADMDMAIGDTELLEAADARTQILQRKGKSYGKAAAKFYGGFFTGMCSAAILEYSQGGK